jgi:hypothetical protein
MWTTMERADFGFRWPRAFTAEVRAIVFAQIRVISVPKLWTLQAGASQNSLKNPGLS